MKIQNLAFPPLLLLFSFMSIQAATPVEECKKLFDNAAYQQADSICTQAAQSGHRAAQVMLGEIKDRQGESEKTAFWWGKAAEAGSQPARNLLALKYYYGGTVFGPEKGWQQDYAKAFSIW